jgi:hypothetical protein
MEQTKNRPELFRDPITGNLAFRYPDVKWQPFPFTVVVDGKEVVIDLLEGEPQLILIDN